MSATHQHYWCYPQAVWGDDAGNYVARYCRCGAMQSAPVGKWGAIPRDQPDIRATVRVALAEIATEGR